MKKMRLAICLLASICVSLPLAAQESKQCEHDAMVCVKYMTAQFENKGWIGIELDFDSENRTAPVIRKVITGSPAEDAGLRPGDVLVSFDGVEYATATEEELREAKRRLAPGHEIILGIRRGGDDLDVTIHAEEIPEGVLAQWIGYHILNGHKEQIAAAESP